MPYRAIHSRKRPRLGGIARINPTLPVPGQRRTGGSPWVGEAASASGGGGKVAKSKRKARLPTWTISPDWSSCWA